MVDRIGFVTQLYNYNTIPNFGSIKKTKGVENGLPWIACRVANADSADHSDVGIHVFREQEIENQKNSASDDVI